MKKNLSLCVVSATLALVLVGSLWFFVGASASSPPTTRTPGEISGADASAAPHDSSGPYRIYLPGLFKAYDPELDPPPTPDPTPDPDPDCEAPPLLWASDEKGVLVRWRWPTECPGGDEFRVYRTGPAGHREQVAQVGPVTDGEEAEELLGDDWGWIRDSLDNIDEVTELLELPEVNPMQAAFLANNHPTVAFVYGWGYYDRGVQPHTIYTYEVEADVPTKGLTPTVALAGGLTPIPAPTGLTVTQVISDDLAGGADWARAQANRKGDRWIFLTWDTDIEWLDQQVSMPVAVGYDIYRRLGDTGDYQRINEQPVVPMPATVPADPQNLDATAAGACADPASAGLDLQASGYTAEDPSGDYDPHHYFYKDEDSSLLYDETYEYRVAPRDLLGRPRGWPEDAADFSQPVKATPRDTMPPAVPQNLSAIAHHLEHKIVLTWTEQLTDTAGYRLYWSWGITASLIESNPTDPEQHWILLADIDSPTTTVYEHTGGLAQDRPYWYRIRAYDDSGNLSAPSEPVFATLRDRVPPGRPGVEVQEAEMENWFVIEHCDEAGEILVYCSVDDGPTRLWTVLTPDGGASLTFDPGDEYAPPGRSKATCVFQAVDASGNRSEFSEAESVTFGSLLIPPAPIITTIRTSEKHEELAALIEWEAEPAPGVTSFRIYRQSYGSGDPPALVGETDDAAARAYADETVEASLLYTYTVAAYWPPGYYGTDEFEVHSEPRLYKAVPPLDHCSRPLREIVWHDESTCTPSGPQLVWQGVPTPHDGSFIVYRSLHEDGHHAQLTPPIPGPSYLDQDAEHCRYWYVVLQLDDRTGEVIAASSPWSADGGLAATSETLSPHQELQAPQPEIIDAVQLDPWVEADLVPPSGAASVHYFNAKADADTYIDAWHPDDNFGERPEMLVGTQDRGLFSRPWAWPAEPSVASWIEPRQTSLVQFDVRQISGEALISDARFRAYGEWAEIDGSVEIALSPVEEPWVEDQVTWSTGPAIDTTTYTTATDRGEAGWIGWDVTWLVQEWVSGDRDNHGLALSGRLADVLFERAFETLDSQHGHNPPQLWVTYTIPPDPAELPDWLRFGDGFTIQVETYEPGSTWDCLTGEGTMQLGGDPLEWFEVSAPFECLTAEPMPDPSTGGDVTDGAAEFPVDPPLEIAYPGGFEYQISEIYVDKEGGRAQISVTLPTDIVVHVDGLPADPYEDWFRIWPGLEFETHTGFEEGCDGAVPAFYFEMNPLPLRVVPIGAMAFTHEHVVFDQACTQYDERFSDERPRFPGADAGDGYLRPIYESEGKGVHIDQEGLHGAFVTQMYMEFATAVPYGIELEVVGGAFELKRSRIAGGHLGPGTVDLEYFQGLDTRERPTGLFKAEFDELLIGLDGAVHGEVHADTSVIWANDGFKLSERTYQLYLPPIQTEGMPWEDVLGSWPRDPRVQPGINRVTETGESVDFTWYHCKKGTEIRFPGGVQADMYLRRGGVSDSITAIIEPGEGVQTQLYGYTSTVNAFGVAFCDNFIFDSDVAADIDLPYPADVLIPLIDVQLDSNTACVDGGKVSPDATPLTVAYWDADLHPTAVEFRETDHDDFEDAALWILGGMDVPHLSLPGANDVAVIPLETSFTPQGNFHDINVVHRQANYTFDGFSFLLERVRLSEWDGEQAEEPVWDPAATLGEPPDVQYGDPHDGRGFVEVQGSMIAPLFGILKDGDGQRPDLQFTTEGSFVGFTSRPSVERGWTEQAGLGFKFDLLYAHSVDEHEARFVGWDQQVVLDVLDLEDLRFFEMDWATVIDPDETGIYVGMSSVPALLRAMADMSGVTEFPDDLVHDWFEALGIDDEDRLPEIERQGYLTITRDIWTQLIDPDAHTTGVLDTYIDALEEDISTPTGGGTTDWLKEWGVNLSEVRGQAAFSPVQHEGATVDWELEELHASVRLNVTWPTAETEEEEDTAQSVYIIELYNAADHTFASSDDNDEDDEKEFVAAKRLTFRMTRDGEYALSGREVRTSLLEQDIDADFDLLVGTEPGSRRFEGGLVIRDLDMQGVYFMRLGAVLGIGQYAGDTLFYVGALGDGKFGTEVGEFVVGGSLLVGSIYDSHVLRGAGFADLLDRLYLLVDAQDGEVAVLTGAYVRVYGDFPIYESGCMARLTAGGELEGYYFADKSGAAAWGGSLRAFVTGELLCVVTARGDLTLAIGTPGSGQKPYYFRGQFWVAGGIGVCSPQTWVKWDDENQPPGRWWGEPWYCQVCGAHIATEYNLTQADGWHTVFTGECK